MNGKRVGLSMLVVLGPLIGSAPIQGICQNTLPPIDLAKVKAATVPYHLEIIQDLLGSEEDEYYPIDLDGDGVDELVEKSNYFAGFNEPNCIQLRVGDYTQVAFRANFEGWLTLSRFFYDLDGDGKKEIFVSAGRADSTFFYVFNTQGKALLSILGAVKPKDIERKWNCGIKAEAAMDVNADGYMDLLLLVETLYAYQPRFVAALDVHNNTILWQYPTGFAPRHLSLFDVNGDGLREILLGSSAPDNGEDTLGRDYIVNGTDDKHVYLTVLDSLGNCLRSQIVGHQYAWNVVKSHDLNGDHRNEIVVAFNSQGHPQEPSFVGLWNPETGNLSRKRFEKNIAVDDIAFIDANGDGEDDFIICLDDGTLEIRDNHLDIINAKQFLDFQVQKIVVADLNNNGEEEIVLSGSFQGRYVNLILNRELKILSFFDFGTGLMSCGFVVRQGFGKEKYLLAMGSGRAYLMAMKKQYPISTALPWRFIGLGFLCGAILGGFLLFLVLLPRHQASTANMLKLIIESMQQGIIVLDFQGKIVALNREMESFLHADSKKCKGLPVQQLFADSNLLEIQELIGSSYQDASDPFEQEITLSREGAPWTLLVGIGPFQMNKSSGIGRLVTIQNLTGMVHSKRTVAWATMAQRLAHEIKTPLSTVMLTTQRLQMEFDDKLKGVGPGSKYLDRIIRQVNRLQKMTDAFLKFAHIESSKSELIEIEPLLRRCLEEYKFQFGLGVRVDDSIEEAMPRLTGDSQQLLIVFQNIINNSLTAMEGKGVLTIRAHLVQWLHAINGSNQHQAIQVEVADTGRGISKEDCDRLFQPFFSKSEAGTGMGLVIVKKIIEDHHGEIKIVSEVGVGTTVFLTLPVFVESKDETC